LRDEGDRRFALAELNDALSTLAPGELVDAVATIDVRGLTPVLQNYVAAMVEQAARAKGLRAPDWTRDVEPLSEPYFATSLQSLRLHLLRAAPLAFKRRNIFVDASIGARV
jgi:predicted ATPase